MRRLLAVATVLASVLVLVGPAQADQTVVVKTFDTTSTPYDFLRLGCDGTLPDGSITALRKIEATTPAPTLGQRSWGMVLNNTAGVFWGMLGYAATSDEL